MKVYPGMEKRQETPGITSSLLRGTCRPRRYLVDLKDEGSLRVMPFQSSEVEVEIP